jgi:hypothetical protein
MVAKLPPRELHSGMAGIDFPRPLRIAGAGKILTHLSAPKWHASGAKTQFFRGFYGRAEAVPFVRGMQRTY